MGTKRESKGKKEFLIFIFIFISFFKDFTEVSQRRRLLTWEMVLPQNQSLPMTSTLDHPLISALLVKLILVLVMLVWSLSTGIVWMVNRLKLYHLMYHWKGTDYKCSVHLNLAHCTYIHTCMY